MSWGQSLTLQRMWLNLLPWALFRLALQWDELVKENNDVSDSGNDDDNSGEKERVLIEPVSEMALVPLFSTPAVRSLQYCAIARTDHHCNVTKDKSNFGRQGSSSTPVLPHLFYQRHGHVRETHPSGRKEMNLSRLCSNKGERDGRGVWESWEIRMFQPEQKRVSWKDDILRGYSRLK